MWRRGAALVLGAVAALALLASAAEAGGGKVKVVIASGGTADCTGFLDESLSGAISGCVPVPFGGGAYPGYPPGAAAADGSVVFIERYAAFGTTDETLTELVPPKGDAVELSGPPGGDHQVAAASISSDGSKVAFLWIGDNTDPTSIYVVNADGSGLRVAAPWNGAYLGAPAISPDGHSIAYWCVSPPDASYPPRSPKRCGPLPDGSYRQSGIMLMNADGTDKRMIVITPTDPFLGASIGVAPSLSWSPNGRWLTTDALATGCVWGLCSSGTPQVFAYRTNGSDLFNYLDPSRRVNTREAPQEKTDGDVPQFCGNSSQILYEAGTHVYLISRDGTHRRRTALTVQPSNPGYPICIPPAGGGGPSPTVNAMRVIVPRVRTLSYTAARQRLRTGGFHVGTVKHAFSAQIQRGHVIAQYPRAGARAHRSTEQGPPVRLVLSRGPCP